MPKINLESGIRLSVCQKTKIDVIRDTVPKPEGYLPPRSLPTWETMPLEQRLPLLPAPPGALYFSRGFLGKTLLRKTKRFCTDDPLNFECVPSNKYEILHDPSVQVEFNQYAVSAMKEDETINENMEVICSQKEFNRYRTYLATIYNEDVRQKIAELEDMRELERETVKALQQQDQDEIGKGKRAFREKRIANAKRLQEEKAAARLQRWKEKAGYVEYRRMAIEEERKQQQVRKSLVNAELRALQIQRQGAMQAAAFERQKRILHENTLRDMTHVVNREHVKKNRKLLRLNRMAQWFDDKTFSAAERLQREKVVQAAYSGEIKRRAIKRQKNVEKFRAELPERIALQLAAKKRLEDIVRKYAMRWLNRVRDKKKKTVDEAHESLWYTPDKNCLDESVDYLYEQSGHGKLDDVVLSILKFKEALKSQMLLEEDEEDDDDEYDE